MPVRIIAEAGVNHGGSIDHAIKLIDVAAAAGADAVKFQTFLASELATPYAEKANYQKATTGSHEGQLEMLRGLELKQEHHAPLIEHCNFRNILFLSTAFDMVSLAFLASLNLPFWKVPSGEITNVPYLRAIASTGKPVIISTGMANLSEVEFALNIFLDANYARDQVTLLHCTTEYPAPIEDVNLRAMVTMREAFGTLVGYSDHTNGIEASIAAVALGATVIEKHFTLDRTLPGPDHAASLEPEELSEMVRCIRNVEVARGSGIKNPTERELGNLVIARKGIYASRPIRKGERFSQENLICKRPLKGLSASMWDLILGRVASRNFEPEEPVDF